MVLHFYTNVTRQKTLCRAFGVSPATLSRTLTEAEYALAETLKCVSLARIGWPSKEEQALWAQWIKDKEPLILHKFGFIDGKNYQVQKPSNPDIQNAYYNGWLHATLVTGTLCFGADGTIIWMKINCPGSWNDGEMSRSFREKLLDERKTLQTHGVVADSAFPVSGNMINRIVTPLKDGDLERSHRSTRAGKCLQYILFNSLLNI
jgi:hypothetical protein